MRSLSRGVIGSKTGGHEFRGWDSRSGGRYNSNPNIGSGGYLMQLMMHCLAVLFALAAAHPALGATGDTTEHRLANGMHVVVKPDRRAPVVVVMAWYRVGSIDEVNGRTGVAHVLEHMMFKGTKTTAVGEYSRVIAAAGGRDNAFTSS